MRSFRSSPSTKVAIVPFIYTTISALVVGVLLHLSFGPMTAFDVLGEATDRECRTLL